MASYNKYNVFTLDLINGKHQFGTHTYNTALSVTAPNASTHAVLADITELTTSGGYTAGGIAVTITTSGSGGVAKATTTTNPLWTGNATTFTFRYAVLYNVTQTTPNKPLVAWWDYGSSQVVGNGETLTVDYDDTNGIFTVT